MKVNKSFYLISDNRDAAQYIKSIFENCVLLPENNFDRIKNSVIFIDHDKLNKSFIESAQWAVYTRDVVLNEQFIVNTIGKGTLKTREGKELKLTQYMKDDLSMKLGQVASKTSDFGPATIVEMIKIASGRGSILIPSQYQHIVRTTMKNTIKPGSLSLFHYLLTSLVIYQSSGASSDVSTIKWVMFKPGFWLFRLSRSTTSNFFLLLR